MAPVLRCAIDHRGTARIPDMNELSAYKSRDLPAGIRSRFVDNRNGLVMHILEAGFERANRPCLLLLHGFPELAYSWRKIMMPLAAAGFHVIAPDQRGYGRTSGWHADYDGDLDPFYMLNLVRDVLGLLAALERGHVTAVIGHDFGSPVAATCALVRPDVFNALVMMSAPIGGPAPMLRSQSDESGGPDIHEELAALPRPRKHYQWYYSTREANADMQHCPQGVHDFLRAYYHFKSADWPDNKPYELAAWDAQSLSVMPTYYIMDSASNMAETVAPEMPDAGAIANCRWLPDEELRVYSSEYTRTGFQGGLQWYRCATGGQFGKEMKTFAGKRIDVPSAFVAGSSDWGVYQKPGELRLMRERGCSRMQGVHRVDGAGHWVQQEQPERVVELLREFLGNL